MTQENLDDEDPNRRRLCATCVGEPFLKAVIRKEGDIARCDFCTRRKGRTFTLKQMADRVEAAFADHYVRTSDQPDELESMAIRYGELDWTRHGEPVGEAIQMAAMIDEPPATAIAEILAERHDTFVPGDVEEEQEFGPDSYYERLDSVEDDHFHQDWERFEQSLKSEARFFSRKAEQVLSDIFSGVTEARTKSGDSVIFAAGPGTALTSIFRARAFQSRDRLEAALARPDLEIAPPPSKEARAGRMNARGVPVFYGATDARIAMAEVRPPVGAEVIVGRFEIVRPLRLLDVAALGKVFVEGSVFDPTLAGRARRASFLATLSRRIIRPVMPDAEDFEYLVTQAMADYLADQPRFALDGVLFPSVQSKVKGANIVLFHKAARAAEFDLPKGTEVQAYLHGGSSDEEYDDGPLTWSVLEETPVPSKNAKSKAADDPLDDLDTMDSVFRHIGGLWSDEEKDPREVSLRLDPQSLLVHRVNAVRFSTTATPVKRSSREKPERESF